MTTRVLKPKPLAREAFAPYGDVIETSGAQHFAINAGAIERFHDLAKVDIGVEPNGKALISIARCNSVTVLPFRIELVERHPLGSQAFIPLSNARLLVVVAPAGETAAPSQLRAFVSNGKQGVNYHRGVWHMPLIAFEEDQEFIIVDRGGSGENCDEIRFDETEKVIVENSS